MQRYLFQELCSKVRQVKFNQFFFVVLFPAKYFSLYLNTSASCLLVSSADNICNQFGSRAVDKISALLWIHIA